MLQLTSTLALILASSLSLGFQEGEAVDADPTFGDVSASLDQELEEALSQLDALQQRIAEEKIPLNRELSKRFAELEAVKAEYQDATRLVDSRAQDLFKLRSRIEEREAEAAYLTNLFDQFVRDFEVRVHIAEASLYAQVVEDAKLALENGTLSDKEIFAAQLELLDAALARLAGLAGGTRYPGTALDSNSIVSKGEFVLVGPTAIFRADDGSHVGVVEQRVGSFEPAALAFLDPADTEAAGALVAQRGGSFPLDPTLGNAHKIEATQESFWEHAQKGGPVMYPIFALAGAAFLVALFKWLGFLFVREPSRKRIEALMEAVEEGDLGNAKERAATLKGPLGSMLAVGVDHLGEPRELVEEVMYETVLKTRLKLQRFLPFIAVSAASAPLLGLLGTVTGIISTFKLITVYGSGDVKTLSGGISEALITTEFGLIVAIPSLLLHAFLSRKAKGIVGRMESAAVTFVNRTGAFKSEPLPAASPVGEVASPGPAPAGSQGEALDARSKLEGAIQDLVLPVVRQSIEGELARVGATAAASANPEKKAEE